MSCSHTIYTSVNSNIYLAKIYLFVAPSIKLIFLISYEDNVLSRTIICKCFGFIFLKDIYLVTVQLMFVIINSLFIFGKFSVFNFSSYRGTYIKYDVFL